MKQTIGIDLDDTLNDLNPAWLDLYNKAYKDNLTPENIKCWDTWKYVKPECGKKIYDFLKHPNLFLNLNVQPNAIEVTQWLAQYYDLYIITAYVPEVCVDKAKWIDRYFPHIGSKKIIFANYKGIINTDFLIDDGAHNITDFENTGLLVNRPWNGWFDYNLRVFNWVEIDQYFENQITMNQL